MSETRSGLHVGSTLSRVADSPWRIVVHWHTDGGQLVPAGVEIRCYGVAGDDENEFWGGQERPNHEQPLLDDGQRSRAVSSDLVKRLKLGPALGEHAAQLTRLLARSADETASMHQGSAAFMREVSALAGGLTRATDATYGLVAALYREALEGPSRSRPAVYVLDRLVDAHDYALDRDSTSDRVKVRQWIGEARKRGYLPKTTANTTRRGSE